MKKIILFLGIICFCFPLFSGISPQSQEKTEVEKREQDKQAVQTKVIAYDSFGRRDPFKDLLEGTESEDENPAEGIAQIAVNNIVLSGIIKVRGNFTAIISDPQGFPLYVKKGDKFLDGYVLSVDSSQVTFLKTKKRGTVLFEPEKIIKRLYDEER